MSDQYLDAGKRYKHRHWTFLLFVFLKNSTIETCLKRFRKTKFLGVCYHCASGLLVQIIQMCWHILTKINRNVKMFLNGTAFVSICRQFALFIAIHE